MAKDLGQGGSRNWREVASSLPQFDEWGADELRRRTQVLVALAKRTWGVG